MNTTIVVNWIRGADFFSESKTPRIFILGRRGSGKSTMARDLLFHYDGVNRAKGVVVPTSRECELFTNYAREYDVNRTILDAGGAHIEWAPESFLAVDDPADPPFNRYTLSGEFQNAFDSISPNILFINVMQYPYHLHLSIADSLDFVCILKGQGLNLTYVHSLYFMYLRDVFPTIEMLCNVLAELAENPYECIVVKLRNRTSLDLCDNIFLYRAELHPTYDYIALRAKMDVHREALAAAVFHPRRLARWLVAGGGDWDP
jgi:hypothetical protein